MVALPNPAELMPHAAPMRLVDRVIAWEQDRLEAAAEVRAGPFVTADGLEAVALIEYMAQAAAALAGMQAQAQGQQVDQGYLVACREAELLRERLAAGTELVLRARLVARSKALVHFECAAQVGSEQVANAKLSVLTGGGAAGGDKG